MNKVQRQCLHAWVAGMVYVDTEDLFGVYELRNPRGETIECEKCDLVYDPRDHGHA